MSGLTPERLAEIRGNVKRELSGDWVCGAFNDLFAHIDDLTAELERLRGPVARAIPIANNCVCDECRDGHA